MSKELVPGAIYFVVVFEDRHLTVPLIRTLRYVEKVEPTDAKPYYMFENLSGSKETEPFVVRVADSEQYVLSQEGLLETLRCAFDGTLSTREGPGVDQ